MSYTEIVDSNGNVLGSIDEAAGTVEMTEEWQAKMAGKKSGKKATGIKKGGRRPAGSGGKTNKY